MPRFRRSRRSFDFDTELASTIDGVVFRATGRMTIDISRERERVDWARVAAAARTTLEAVAGEITENSSPRNLVAAQQKLSDRLGVQTAIAEFAASSLTARCRLWLSTEDERRTRIFYDTMRSEQLQLAIDRQRMAYLGEVLGDRRLARLWWLDRHQEQMAEMTWDVFDEHILSELVLDDGPESKAERIARAMARVFEKMESNPLLQKQFLATAEVVMGNMDWKPLWDDIQGGAPARAPDSSGRSDPRAGD
ncbi:hypothetical protein ACIA49_04060 [Kribbella sp. NPDC051587]|uniref:hypothetical protein n=1 Tax=Kribbella sp. NPDC051587 TaxID=3364119 RepID=UPI00378DA94C